MGQKKEEIAGCQACTQKAAQEQDPDSCVKALARISDNQKRKDHRVGMQRKAGVRQGNSGAGQVSSWNLIERFQMYIEVICSAVSNLNARD